MARQSFVVAYEKQVVGSGVKRTNGYVALATGVVYIYIPCRVGERMGAERAGAWLSVNGSTSYQWQVQPPLICLRIVLNGCSPNLHGTIILFKHGRQITREIVVRFSHCGQRRHFRKSGECVAPFKRDCISEGLIIVFWRLYERVQFLSLSHTFLHSDVLRFLLLFGGAVSIAYIFPLVLIKDSC